MPSNKHGEQGWDQAKSAGSTERLRSAVAEAEASYARGEFIDEAVVLTQLSTWTQAD